MATHADEPDAITLAEAEAARAAAGTDYLQFMNRGSLSVGLYVLPAGGDDPQSPHAEDEVYYVVAGRGRLRAGDRDDPAVPGAVLFVGKGVEHRFHSIEEDLALLVVFAPEHRQAG